MEEDFYKILGVERSATPAEIKKAHRDLAAKYHPDANPDKRAKQRFQQIQKAYEVLSDVDKRKAYDQFGSAFEQMEGGGPQGAWRTTGGHGPEFGDIDFSQYFGGQAHGGDTAGGFDEIFRHFAQGPQGGPGQGAQGHRNSRAGRRGGHRGGDVTHEVEIAFQTAVQGGEVRLNLRRPGGKTETLEVKIPAGIEDGKAIRLRGQGESAPMPGDLLLTIRIAPHPHYTRRGADLTVRLPVTLAEAALGAKVDVPTPWGTIAVKVPAGTSSGKRLRVKGHGVRQEGKTQGDLYVELAIVLPSELDEASLDLIRKFAELHPQRPRGDVSW